MIRKRLFISIAIFSSFITIVTAQAKEDLQNTSIDSLPKVAVFLSGGAARGLCHLGFLSVLEEYKIPIDIIVGVSIGSIVGGYYAYGYSVDDLLNKARECSIISLIDFEHPKPNKSEPKKFKRKSITIDSADKAIGRIPF